MRRFTLPVTLAIVAAISMTTILPVELHRAIPVSPLRPAPAAASELELFCGGGMVCQPSTSTQLYDHPIGPLSVSAFEPWARVVQGENAKAWAPIEAEARAAIAARHGVPNDRRLLLGARDQIRSYMMARLLQIIDDDLNDRSLSGVEQDALDALEDAIVQRKVSTLDRSIAEYDRWAADPCGFQPPVLTLDPPVGQFAAYNTGTACTGGGLTFIGGPPRPPTFDQFLEYGIALDAVARQESGTGDLMSADALRMQTRFDQALQLMAGGLIGAAVGLVATAASFASPAVATFFVTVMNSFLLAKTAVMNAALASGSISITATGAAFALPFVVIAGAVAVAIALNQQIEDGTIRPKLVFARDGIRRDGISWRRYTDPTDEESAGELVAAFLGQTVPAYEPESFTAEVMGAPTAPLPGDPTITVDGVPSPTFLTRNHDSLPQETFISSGWFVTRTMQSNGLWGPRRWSLLLPYRSDDTLAGLRYLAIRPGGFIDMPTGRTGPGNDVTTFQAYTGPGTIRTVALAADANVPPSLRPSLSAAPDIGQTVTLRANATDPNPGDTVSVAWYVEGPNQVAEAACGDLPVLSGAAPTCTIPARTGEQIDVTFDRAGVYRVLVVATDGAGATRAERFEVAVAASRPTITIDTPAPASVVQEGASVRITGSFDYAVRQAISGQTFQGQATLVVDWGDGTSLRRAYPCDILTDSSCQLELPSRLYAGGSGPGPWPIDLQHTYVHRPDRPLTDPVEIAIYVIGEDGSTSEVVRRLVDVDNTTPTITPFAGCQATPLPLRICPVPADIRETTIGQPITLRATVQDTPGSAQRVELNWDDGSIGVRAAGCTDPGCLGYAVGALPPGFTRSNVVELTHTYWSLGVYDVDFFVDDGGPNGTRGVSGGQVRVVGISDLAGPSQTDVFTPVTATYSAVYPDLGTGPGGIPISPIVQPTCDGEPPLAFTDTSITCLVQRPGPYVMRIAVTAGVFSFSTEKTITVQNNPPVAVADTITTDEDTQVSGNVLTNDTDLDGETPTAEVVTDPLNGNLTLLENGSFTYVPRADFNGPDGFTYRITDASGASSETTVEITVAPVDDAPTAIDDNFITLEELEITGNVLDNDIEVDGEALGVELVDPPASGTVALNPDGTFSYTPDPDFSGRDAFTYLANDGTNVSNVATVEFEVRPVGDRPVAADDNYETDEDTFLVVDAPGVLANDSDADADEITVSSVTQPQFGTLRLTFEGGFVYTPDPNYHGTDSFTYSVSDGTGESNTATVTITVNPVNDAPLGRADTYETAEDTPLTIGVPGVLVNDSDADEGDRMILEVVTEPSSGTLRFSDTGAFSYTPDPDFSGEDSFTYRISDRAGASDVATVTITVTPVNDPPTAVDDSYETDEDSRLRIDSPGLLANDGDIDSARIVPVIVTPPSFGTLLLDTTGGFVYIPNANYNGPDSFAYRVSDGALQSEEATVDITVRPVDDAPTVTVVAALECSADLRGVMSLRVDDIDTPASGLTLSVSSSNTTLVPIGNVTFAGTGQERTITVSAASRRSGTATLVVSVGDGTSTGSASVGVVVGTTKSDTLLGSSLPDVMFGSGGNDSLTGAGGNDLLCGGAGTDTLRGGDGNDALFGGDGNDLLEGGADDDRLLGERGQDTLTGGSGADLLDGGANADRVTDLNLAEGDTQLNVP